MCQKEFLRNFCESRRVTMSAAAYAVGPWPRFREITPKFLHDDHTTRLAWRVRRSRHDLFRAMSRAGAGGRRSEWPDCSSTSNLGEVKRVGDNLSDCARHPRRAP